MSIKLPGIDDVTDTDLERRLKVKTAVELLDIKGWFDYKRAQEIFTDLDVAYYEAEKAQQTPNYVSDIRPLGLIIVGDVNNGKTTLAIRYINMTKKAWAIEHPEETWNNFNIVYYEIGSRITIKRLLAALLSKFGRHIDDNALKTIHTDTLVQGLITQLKENAVKLLIIDELQDMIEAPKEDINSIFVALKKITNQSLTRLVLIGTEGSVEVLREAEKLQEVGVMKPWIDEKFRALDLSRWKASSEFADLMFTVYHVYKPAIPEWNIFTGNGEDLRINEEVADILLQLSDGRLGKLLQIIKYAAIRCLLDNRKNITKEDYCAVFNKKYVMDNKKLMLIEEKKEKAQTTQTKLIDSQVNIKQVTA